MVSGVIEKQDIMNTGSTEKSTLDKLFAFFQVNTTDVLGTPGAYLNAAGDTLSGIGTVLSADYSFCHDNTLGEIWHYFMLAVGFGILFTIGLMITLSVKGG